MPQHNATVWLTHFNWDLQMMKRQPPVMLQGAAALGVHLLSTCHQGKVLLQSSSVILPLRHGPVPTVMSVRTCANGHVQYKLITCRANSKNP